MNIAVEGIYACLLICIGYIAVCFYLQGTTNRKGRLSAIRIYSKSRALYLLLAVLFSGVVIAFFHTYYVDNSLIHNLKLLTLLAVIYPVAAIDYKRQVIPNIFILAALVIRVLFYIGEFILDTEATLEVLKSGLLGGVIIGGFFLILALVFKNSIGMGDIKLFFVMGLYQGIWGALNAVFFSLLVSFFVAVALLLTKKKKRKDTISFGPNILLGTVVGICLAGI